MRLIDADALLERKENLPTIGGNGWCHRDYVDTIWINRSPTIDAVPMVQSEWEVAIGYDADKKVQCQNCFKMAHEPTAYCPNCGAKMDARGGD